MSPFPDLSLASCLLLLPVSSLLLQCLSSCVLGPMPGGVDLLEASSVSLAFAFLHTLPLWREQECPSFSPAQKNARVPGQLLSSRIQIGGGGKFWKVWDRCPELLCG